MKHSVAALIVVASLVVCAAAQTPIPPRDRSAPPPSGTGRIRGRVVAADTGAPLRRAQVHLGSSESRVNRTVSTDAEGRFDVTDLPDGSYFLTVTRNGYASLQFGQQRPFEPGRTLELTNGRLIDRVDFALPRGGVIAGRVTDQLGRACDWHIHAGNALSLSARWRAAVGSCRWARNVQHGHQRSRRVPCVWPDARHVRIARKPEREAGCGLLGGMVTVTEASGDSLGYVTTYYPGTVSPAQAEPIGVGVGDVANVSFALSTARLTRVSGTVRDSQGRPVTGATIGLRSRTPTGGWTMSGPQISSDGKFSIANVPPGDYSIEVVPRSTAHPTGGERRVR